MSWLKKAYTICNANPDDYYVVVDLPTFYEWQFTNTVPEGTVITRQMPRSDVLAENVIIASMSVPQDAARQFDDYFRLEKDVPAAIKHVAGQSKTPGEVVASFDRVAARLDSKVHMFKQNCSANRYFIAGSEELHLYRIRDILPDRVILDNIGTVKDLNSKIADLQRSIESESVVKEGRAIEAADSRRFDKAVTKLRNSSIPLDSTDLDFLISRAGITPVNSRNLSWKQCLLETSPEAQEAEQKMSAFNSLKWVQQLARSI